MNKVPNEPPFTAFIGNLAYETTEENIVTFFKKLSVSITLENIEWWKKNCLLLCIWPSNTQVKQIMTVYFEFSHVKKMALKEKTAVVQ